jgi:hypothetical protein
MPAVVGTTSFQWTGSGFASLTFAHTATGDPLYVCASISDNVKEYRTVTYAGIQLERIGRVTGSAFSQEWWFLANPPAGTANVIVSLLQSTEWLAVSARNVSGVDLDGFAKNLTTAAATSVAPALTIPSAPGDLVLDFLSQNANSQVYTPGAGQTQDWAISATGNDHYSAGSRKAGAASVPMSWGLSISTPWLYSAISIPAAGTIPPVDTRVTQDAIEVLTQPVLPEARVSKYAVEVLSVSVARVWVSQMVIETISLPPAPARISQVAVETITIPPSPGRVSQVAVETLFAQPSASGFKPTVWMGDGFSNPWIE